MKFEKAKLFKALKIFNAISGSHGRIQNKVFFENSDQLDPVPRKPCLEDRLVVLLGEHLEGGERLFGHVHALDHLQLFQQGGYRLHNHCTGK